MKIKEKFVNLVYISSLPKCCCTACPTYIHVLNWTISESEGSWKILGIDSLKILSNQQTKTWLTNCHYVKYWLWRLTFGSLTFQDKIVSNMCVMMSIRKKLLRCDKHNSPLNRVNLNSNWTTPCTGHIDSWQVPARPYPLLPWFQLWWLG